MTDICQISMEFHDNLKEVGLTDSSFAEILIKFLEESPYVPVPGLPRRFALINIVSEKCKLALFK